jgi:hypothetical protein
MGGLEAQEVVVLRMRKNSESRVRAREEENDGKLKFWSCARRVVLKGQVQPLTFNVRSTVSAKLSPTRVHALAKQPTTRATPQFP